MVIFSEQIGSLTSDTLTVPATTIAYGLGGDDILSTAVGNIGNNQTNYSILVGGSGAERYIVANNSTAIILDNGNSAGDFIEATGIGFNSITTVSLEIDNRHLFAYDTISGQASIILDWQDAANTIESVQFSDGTFTYDYVASNFRNTGGYLGSFTLEEADHQFLGDSLAANGLTRASLYAIIDKIKTT